MENTIKMANRYGLNLKLTNIKDETDTAVIDFANEVSLEISGEITWATGGQGHVKMIGFKDPKEGTLVSYLNQGCQSLCRRFDPSQYW